MKNCDANYGKTFWESIETDACPGSSENLTSTPPGRACTRILLRHAFIGTGVLITQFIIGSHAFAQLYITGSFSVEKMGDFLGTSQ